jgi:hypothetical protein
VGAVKELLERRMNEARVPQQIVALGFVPGRRLPQEMFTLIRR